MDGKKRIARLRNAEAWKKLGFGCFFEVKHGVKAKTLKPGLFGKKKAKKVRPRMTFDWMRGEYVEAKPGRFVTAHNMIDALEKKGFKRLGSGHYSTVLAHPKSPDKVLKVTRHQDNWIDYVKWAAEKGYAGGFAPRVYSWKKFPGGWSWAVMERMERTIGGEYDDMSYPGDGPSVQREDDYALIFSLLQHASSGNLLAEVYCEDLCPGAFPFVKELRSTMRASDIRGPNTMLRKDGSLCFTDPCAGETKITKTRLRSGDFSPSVWRYLSYYEGCYRH